MICWIVLMITNIPLWISIILIAYFFGLLRAKGQKEWRPELIDCEGD